MDKPKTILVASRWYDHRFYKGIIRYATKRGWHISPYNFASNFAQTGWPADGAITCYSKPLAEFIDDLGVPMVDITTWETPERVPQVVVDNEEIGRMAARHFLERGFKHFAYYSWSSVHVNSVRQACFFRALAHEGVPPENIHQIEQLPDHLIGRWELHHKHVLDQLEKLPRPLGIFTSHDALAASMLEVCMHSNIQVPEEVSVLGVDNIKHLCEALSVPLSSIDSNIERLGYTAAQQLDRLMKKEISNDEPPLLVPAKELVCRQSSNTLAVSHSKVVEALEFIETHYHEPITLENICQHINMSRRGLEKAFLQHLGSTPSIKLRCIRMASAKRMLTETKEKVSSIALACGYSSNSNLSAAFRRETGVSPRTYRLRHSKDGSA
jgi:LacI family transcriptional regulator